MNFYERQHPLKAFNLLERQFLLDHIAIATPTLERGSEPYTALGLIALEPDEEISSQQVRIRVFRVGESLIELLEPTSSDSPIARFLEKRGPGLHHMALRVENLEREMKRLGEEGAQFLSSTPQAGRAGTRVAFLHPKWAGGTLLELIEHPPEV